MNDNHLLKWLESRFEALSTDIVRIIDQLAKLDEKMSKCRNHCDGTTRTFSDRFAELEKAQKAIEVAAQVEKNTSDQYHHKQDLQAQQGQYFWIKVTGLVGGATALSTIISMLLAHHWGR